jgi:1-acyl-sn-glycerol-3-phosphate acyltransferase
MWRAAYRSMLVLAMAPLMPPVGMTGKDWVIRVYCRVLLRCVGVRLTKSGSPIRNVPGLLVVSPHISWVDVLVIYTLVPGSFVVTAEVADWPGIGLMTRVMKAILIERARLRQLPEVIRAMTEQLRSGHTVVAFPEGTTWCGLAHGPFRPAMFQAAIDAGRPVQPLHVTYHHRDGTPSTMPAFLGDDTFPRSYRRLVTARHTVAHVQVEELQLPGASRRELALRCEQAVWRKVNAHKHLLAS